MELAQSGKGVEFASKYGGAIGGIIQSNFMEVINFLEMKGSTLCIVHSSL